MGGDPAFSLGVEKARQLTRRICETSSEFMSDVGNALSATDATSAPVDYVDRVRLRYAPGAVIDFPEMKVKWQERAFLVRFCITVCLHESRSKVWVRLVECGDPVTGIEKLDPAREQTSLDTLVDAILEAVVRRYEGEIQQFSESSVAGRERVTFRALKRFAILAYDTDLPGLLSLAGLARSSMNTGLRAELPASEAIRFLTEKMHSSDDVNYGRRRDVESREMFSHETVNGCFGVFSAEWSGPHVCVVGLVGSQVNINAPLIDEWRDASAQARRVRSIHAHELTASLSNKLAHHF